LIAVQARTVRLKRLFRRRDITGRADLPLLSVYREFGVVLREGRDDNFNRPGEDLAAYQMVRPGDLVLNKMKTWQGSLGISAFEGIVSPAYFVGEPVSSDDQRFLHHLLRSKPMIAEYRRRSKGIRPSQWDLPWEEFLDIRVDLPSITVQRAIADYLDQETIRIDTLIAAKQRMIELVSEKESQLIVRSFVSRGFTFPTALDAAWHKVTMPADWRAIRLSQCLKQLTNGYVGPTRDILRDEGVKYIQSLHIKHGKIDFARHPFFVDETWHRDRPRIHLRVGDVLIVQTGDIGQVAVVPEAFGDASCHALQIARVRTDFLSGEFLGAYLRSPFGYQSLLSRATGALHPHLEGGIRDVPIIVPPLAAQAEILRDLASRRPPLEQLIGTLEHQMSRLGERRQALITSAVTGELAISGAA
jgi:type I restriction enzyme, S subunit